MPPSSSAEEAFFTALRSGLPSLLPEFLAKQRWFGGKARTIRSVEVRDIVPFYPQTLRCYFVLAWVEYSSGPAETYDIPLVRVADESADPGASWLRVQTGSLPEDIVLKDALTDEAFLTGLLEAMARGASLRGARGQIRSVSTPAFHFLWQPTQDPLTPSLMNAEQSNSSVVYGKRLVLKMFRRVEEGLNPDLEIGFFLTAKTSFRNVPPLAAYLEYLNQTGTS